MTTTEDSRSGPPLIVHVITGLPRAGAEMTLLRLVRGIDPGRYRSVVVSLTDEGVLGPELRAAGAEVHCLGMRPGRFSPTGFWRLLRLLRALRPAVLQTWLWHADLIGSLAWRLTGHARLIWTIRCSTMDARYTRGLNRLMLALLARLSRWPVVIVSNSEAGRAAHQAIGYDRRRWRLIPNGIDTQVFGPDAQAYAGVRQELGLPPQALILGLVARYDPIKDHATFLRAVADLGQALPALHVVAIGAGIDAGNRELADLVARTGMSQRMHLLGERRDVARLTAAFDVAACTSTSEGFPNVLVEAMACGVPCVSTDVGDARLIVGDTGIVVGPGDAGGLAAGIRSLLERDADERRRLGADARARVQSRFSLQSMADAYAELYREVIAQPLEAGALPGATPPQVSRR